MKWLITILMLAVLGGGGFAGWRYWADRQANSPARPAQTLKALRLGQDINDIQFEIGKRLPHAKVGEFVVYQHPVGPAGDDGAAADVPEAPEPPDAAKPDAAYVDAAVKAGTKAGPAARGGPKGDAAKQGNAAAKGDGAAGSAGATKTSGPVGGDPVAKGGITVASDGAPGDDAAAKGNATANPDGMAPATPSGNASLRLFTADGMVAGISYGCAATGDDTALDRIQCGQPLAEILRTYHGLELIQFCNPGDVLSRYVDLPRQGKSFLLVRNKVVELWIRRAGEDAQFPHEGGWHACSKSRKA